MNQRWAVQLGDICSRITDGTHQAPMWSTAGVPFLFVSNVRDGALSFDTEKFVSDVEYERLTKNCPIEPGDVLYTAVGSYGRAALVPHGPKFVFQRHIAHIKPRRDLVDPAYLLQVLESPLLRQQADKVARGGAQKTVTLSSLREFQLPLPPLDEQRRIAAILDKADALRQKRKRAIALLDGLTQSIFVEMFGDLASDCRWDRVSLQEVTSIDAPMVSPKLSKYAGLLHYGPDRIEKDTGRLLPALTAKQDGLISGKFLCTPEHVLYSKIRPYLNKVALCETECLCSADVYPVTANGNRLDRMFLWFILRSQNFLKYAESCSNRANIPKLNRDQFFGYETIVPPIGLQHEFAERLVGIRAMNSQMDQHLELSENAFSSLQRRAFSGQL